MNLKKSRFFMLLLAMMMVFTSFAATSFAADTADSGEEIYFSDRDTESYYGGRNNMYFTPLYILNDGRREVAYCYNGTRAWALAAPGKPGYSIEGQHDKDYYIENGMYFTKVENPTAKDWADYSDNAAEVNKVKKVLYAGYPYNAAGIQDKYNLDDYAYRAATQAAIWNVTDGISLNAALGDFTYTGFVWTQAMTEAYNELVTTAATVTPPANFMMNLYVSKNDQYQNLLSTGLTIDEINHMGTGVINISKKVTGEAGEMDKDFTFKVEFKDASGNEITTAFDYSGSKEGTVKSGETITLKSGESVKIVGLPLDVTYKITEVEANADGYTTTAKGDEGTVSPADKSASFENHRDEVPADNNTQEAKDGGDDESDATDQTEDNQKDDEEGTKDETAKTGDQIPLYLLFMLMAASAACIVVMRRKSLR